MVIIFLQVFVSHKEERDIVGGHNKGPVKVRAGVHTVEGAATVEMTVGVAEMTAGHQ